MEPEKSDQPLHTDETEKHGRQDGDETPSHAAYPGADRVPESGTDAGLGSPPSPSTADDELQRRGRQLEEIEGLTDNKAGG